MLNYTDPSVNPSAVRRGILDQMSPDQSAALSPEEEAQYQMWALANGKTSGDFRQLWKSTTGARIRPVAPGFVAPANLGQMPKPDGQAPKVGAAPPGAVDMGDGMFSLSGWAGNGPGTGESLPVGPGVPDATAGVPAAVRRRGF